jgi:hypothetical protein
LKKGEVYMERSIQKYGLLLGFVLSANPSHVVEAQVLPDPPPFVQSYQKISNTEGSFTAIMNDDDQMGTGLAGLGDLDGDGVVDIALGAHGDDDVGSNTGALYILFLNNNGTVKSYTKITGNQSGFTESLHNGNRFGRKVVSLGDIDEDGVVDIAVGVAHDSDNGTLHGAVYILFLNRDGTVKHYQKISETDGGFTDRLSDNNIFGDSVANAGDIDGDGVTDLAVGAEYDNDGGPLRGAVWILFLNRNGSVKFHQKISSTQGGVSLPIIDNDGFGIGVSPLGDFDGDGVNDIAVGTAQAAVWLLFLNNDGTVKSYKRISNTEGGFEGVLTNSSSFGSAVDLLGDLNADGVKDLLVGAVHDIEAGVDRGAAWILFLNTDGSVKAYQKISATQGGFTGILDPNDAFGIEVRVLGDINGDGVVDIGIGAEDDDDGGPSRGAAWILFLNQSNQAPVANAGLDQTAHQGSSVTLDGSASFDPDENYPLTYHWNIKSKPSGSFVALSDATIMNPTFLTDSFGDYVIDLIVADSSGQSSAPNEVMISTFNTAPVADAGVDQVIIENGSVVNLNGSQSYDDEGDAIFYFWSFVSKPAGSLSELNDPFARRPSFVSDVHGEYNVQLIVTDVFGAESKPDTVAVSFDNVKPAASAGTNQSVVVGDTVLLNGSGSSDLNSDFLTYTWSIVNAPAGSQAQINNANDARTYFIADVAGTYVVSLVVNDGFEVSDPSNITVVAITIQDALTQVLQNAALIINNLPDGSFKNKKMKNSLTNKINVVLDKIVQGLYQEALDKLKNDILQKTDGCFETGNPDQNDWILTCPEQGAIYPFLEEAISFLYGLI